MEGLQFRLVFEIKKDLCLKSTNKSIKTQLIEHRIKWKTIIITLKEMSRRKIIQGFKKLVQHHGEKVEVDIPTPFLREKFRIN